MMSAEKMCIKNDAAVKRANNKNHPGSKLTSTCTNNKTIYSYINCWIATVVVSFLIFPSEVLCDNGLVFAIPQTVNAQLQHIDQKNVSKKDQAIFWKQAEDRIEPEPSDDNDTTYDVEYDYDTVNENAQYSNYESVPLKSIKKTAETFSPPPPRREMPTGCPNGRVCPNSQSIETEESKLIEIEKLKARILKGLNMKAPPNITIPKLDFDSAPLKSILRSHGFKADRIDPTKVEEQYNEYEEEEEVISREEIVMSIAKPVQDERFPTRIRFSFTETEMDQRAKAATLWIYIKPNVNAHRTMTLRLSRFEPDSSGILQLIPFDQKVLKIYRNTQHGKWWHFNFHHTVNSWLLARDLNHGLVISSPDHPELLEMGDEQENWMLKPMVEVTLVSSISKRKRRSLTCTEETNESRCCKYNFIIDFAAIDWNFVIAPKTFNIFYCAGNCPYIMLMTGFKRMMQQSQQTYLATDRRRKGAQGCCSPARLKPLSMLYFDDNRNVIYSTLPDMIVEECGCL